MEIFIFALNYFENNFVVLVLNAKKNFKKKLNSFLNAK